MAVNSIYNTEKFIAKSLASHSIVYDYSKSVFVQSEKEVEIICKIHGPFFQRARYHMKGGDCPKCAMIISHKKRSEKAAGKIANALKKEIKEKYSNLKTHPGFKIISHKEPVVLNCNIHGLVRQLPITFIKKGCVECYKEKQKNNRTAERIRSLFGGANFKLCEHDSSYIIIDCEKHGPSRISVHTIFKKDRISPCKACNDSVKKNDFKGGRKGMEAEKFIEKSNKVHNGKYDYLFSFFTGLNNDVLIRCKRHGFFKQKAKNHIDGRIGCKKCLSDLYESWSKRPKADRVKRAANRVSTHKRRADKFGVYYEPVNRRKVFIRDKWKCQVCGTKTQKKDIHADNAAELGHIVPMSKGGSHSYVNVQCECKKCNAIKGDNVKGEQITIFTKFSSNEG